MDVLSRGGKRIAHIDIENWRKIDRGDVIKERGNILTHKMNCKLERKDAIDIYVRR